MLIAGVTYFALLLAFPEPAGVYGPEGPRLVRAADRPLAPVTPAVPEAAVPTVSAPPVASPALAGSDVDA
jgi:hypothetical protein